MGISGINNLKSDNEVLPEWPMVQCIKCNTVYKVEKVKMEKLDIIEGDCPNCHFTIFYTRSSNGNC